MRLTPCDSSRRLSPCRAYPVRRAAGRRFQRANDHRFDLLIGDRPVRTGPRFVIESVEPLPHDAAAPFADRCRRHMQAARHDLAVAPLGTRQDDPRAPRPLPIAIDARAIPIAAVRLPSGSTQPWGVPFACSPPWRAVRTKMTVTGETLRSHAASTRHVASDFRCRVVLKPLRGQPKAPFPYRISGRPNSARRIPTKLSTCVW
jgi:hypothetical protein